MAYSQNYAGILGSALIAVCWFVICRLVAFWVHVHQHYRQQYTCTNVEKWQNSDFIFSTITDILRKKSTAPLLYSIAIGCLVSALQMIDMEQLKYDWLVKQNVPFTIVYTLLQLRSDNTSVLCFVMKKVQKKRPKQDLNLGTQHGRVLSLINHLDK